MPPVYLASASPRRRELLEQIGLEFSVIIRNVDEDIEQPVSPGRMVELLSWKKAAKVAEELETGLVIGSDTVVVWRDQIMGKPADRQEAVEMLSRLQGDRHRVYSGLAVIDAETGRFQVAHEMTEVYFGPASMEEIESYVDSGEPMDKAGAYAIQGLGAVFIKGIKGCFFNVVGLPVFRLSLMLKDFGVDVLRK